MARRLLVLALPGGPSVPILSRHLQTNRLRAVATPKFFTRRVVLKKNNNGTESLKFNGFPGNLAVTWKRLPPGSSFRVL
jgi:hypothetical protein